MKKILLLTILTFLLSCDSDDISNSQNENHINPPSWIKGTWTGSSFEQNGKDIKRGFIFKEDDWCISLFLDLNIPFGTENCQRDKIILANINNIKASATEEISNERYYIKLTLPTEIYFFEFLKISSNQISIKSTYTNEGVFNKVL
jgi:hypothetical protein